MRSLKRRTNTHDDESVLKVPSSTYIAGWYLTVGCGAATFKTPCRLGTGECVCECTYKPSAGIYCTESGWPWESPAQRTDSPRGANARESSRGRSSSVLTRVESARTRSFRDIIHRNSGALMCFRSEKPHRREYITHISGPGFSV